MGRPKLLLPWGGATVIEQVLRALREGGCRRTVVVARRDDTALAEVVRRHEALLVAPEQEPPDMRASVEHALQAIRETCQPTAGDAWLLTPADHPTLQAAWVAQLIAAQHAQPDRMIVPTHAGRRGHPVLFPWPLAEEVFRLPADVGINELLRRQQERICEVPIDSSDVLADLDTREDYERLVNRNVEPADGMRQR